MEHRRKGNVDKIKMAGRMQGQTTVKWMAERLEMGARTHLNKRLYDYGNERQGRSTNVERTTN